MNFISRIIMFVALGTLGIAAPTFLLIKKTI